MFLHSYEKYCHIILFSRPSESSFYTILMLLGNKLLYNSVKVKLHSMIHSLRHTIFLNNFKTNKDLHFRLGTLYLQIVKELNHSSTTMIVFGSLQNFTPSYSMPQKRNQDFTERYPNIKAGTHKPIRIRDILT